MQPTRLLRSGNEPKPNITGFEVRKFVNAATRPPKYDPWENAEAWRYSGQFSRWNRFSRALPGFGIASVAFAAYCGYEYFFLQDSHKQHGEGHGEGHH